MGILRPVVHRLIEDVIVQSVRLTVVRGRRAFDGASELEGVVVK